MCKSGSGVRGLTVESGESSRVGGQNERGGFE